jgi:hypothetical protein
MIMYWLAQSTCVCPCAVFLFNFMDYALRACNTWQDYILQFLGHCCHCALRELAIKPLFEDHCVEGRMFLDTNVSDLII